MSDPWQAYDKKGPPDRPVVPEVPFYGLLMTAVVLTMLGIKRLKK